jgi:hypothetical protein
LIADQLADGRRRAVVSDDAEIERRGCGGERRGRQHDERRARDACAAT